MLRKLQELKTMCKSSSSLESPEKYDVVISGAGPAGLASAWEAALAGKSVLIISDRKMEYMRFQRVALFPETRKYLLDMLNINGKLRKLCSPTDDEEIKFVLELIERSTVAIKDIERFIKRRLDELQKHRRITYLEEFKISKINMSQGILNAESCEEKPSEQKFLFDCIIAADGTKHPAANILNKEAAQPYITYHPITGPAHRFHMSANVTIERVDEEKLELPAKQVVSSTQSRAWITYLDSHAKSFTGKKIKTSFVGEVPRSVFDSVREYNGKPLDRAVKENAEAKSTAYIKQMIQPFLEEKNLNKGAELKVALAKPSKKYGDKKDRLKLRAFETEFCRANVAAIEISERKFILAGDAFSTPNYQFGHGVNHALKHARGIGRIFKGGDIAQYNERCKSLSSAIEFGTKVTNCSCLRRFFLGWAIERAVERDRAKFFKEHEPLKNKLRMREVKQEVDDDIDERQPLLLRRAR